MFYLSSYHYNDIINFALFPNRSFYIWSNSSLYRYYKCYGKSRKTSTSPNESQIINVQVFDANTNETIGLAYVDLIVKDSNNLITRIFSGLTDETGKFSYIWKIDKNAEPGAYSISLDIIATGYKPLAKTETFTVYNNVNDGNTTTT